VALPYDPPCIVLSTDFVIVIVGPRAYSLVLGCALGRVVLLLQAPTNSNPSDQ
jgi:hypothetical protein